ncbi:MAG: hypothetical protein EP330_11845 [Deltaproteobacteria bacterium]|nr:MAG: hypothetical protein EP330_11845 [Deltaproteobacteria bacterium]
MDIVLTGSAPAAVTAGILLLTRARQLGLLLHVQVLSDETDWVPVEGPALLYAPPLAGCGVGREEGVGGTVIVPGPPGRPLIVSATPHGVDGWFEVGRSGEGAHPATQAYVRLSKDPRVPARRAAKQLRRAMETLGMSTDPAVLDVLFGAEVPPLTRISLALRAGRALSGTRGQPITRYVNSSFSSEDPLPADLDADAFREQLEGSELAWILDGLSTAIRDDAEEWLETIRSLAREDHGRDLPLAHALAELASHLVQLPAHSILPPLGAAEDSVAVGLRAALGVDREGDALRQLIQMYRFLGGKFVTEAEYQTFEVCEATPPGDHIGNWTWFCTQVRRGRRRAEELWPDILEPPQ